jgi:hypothetical protein
MGFPNDHVEISILIFISGVLLSRGLVFKVLWVKPISCDTWQGVAGFFITNP